MNKQEIALEYIELTVQIERLKDELQKLIDIQVDVYVKWLKAREASLPKAEEIRIWRTRAWRPDCNKS